MHKPLHGGAPTPVWRTVALFSVLNAVLVGVVATIALDLVAGTGAALRVFDFPQFGRWFLYALKGTFRHTDIERAPPLRGEGVLTFPLHYAAGILLAGVYLILLDALALGNGNVFLATAYGAATSLIPFFLMLPSMGYGLFGLRHARDPFWLREILLMHLGYGFGIGIAVLFLVPG